MMKLDDDRRVTALGKAEGTMLPKAPYHGSKAALLGF